MKITGTYDETLVIRKLLPIKHIPCTVKCPFKEESSPSFSIYYRNNKIRWKYHTTGESGDIIELVKKMFNLNTYGEAMDKINADLLSTIPHRGRPTIEIKQKNVEFKFNMINDEIIYRDYDIEYWKQFIDEYEVYPLLLKHQCLPVNVVYIDGSVRWVSTATNPIYVYIEEHEGQLYYKVYRPYAPRRVKFFSTFVNNSQYCIHNYLNLPPVGDTLIITKSAKDCIVLDSLGFNAVSVQGEGSSYPIAKEIFIDLRNRFKNIYLLYDTDYNKEQNWGQINAEKVTQIYNIKNIVIPEELKCTDISEVRKVHDKKSTLILLKTWMKQAS